ncbi:hypothetical protein [Frigidibacter mobilis]|uniref:Uncharacterized protein n=1 Tax=Frigidibacter mobilis TaxID=1335048 RepID=A0A165SI52_9RHOB|nr:hypothetical protein [Frigidibacter mobilis]AMY68309.1 hypothetical protein AKL17_1050 [Frigidibacter mobilis]
MFDHSRFTVQDALDLIESGTPPLAFGTGVAVYRAAVKRLAKTSVPSLLTGDLATIPMSLAFVDLLFSRIELQPPVSKKERDHRSQWKSRLRTIARLLEGVPVVGTTAGWDACLAAVKSLAKARGLKEQALIPITSTIRQAAVEDGREPSDLTHDWLVNIIKKSSPKRRDSLRQGAKLLDDFWPELPSQLRPSRRFGAVEIVSLKRRSLPLPPRVAEQLEAYLARRVAGKTAQGFVREVTVEKGLKAEESTNIYRQALGWLFDCLCVAGELTPEAELEIADLARLDWLCKVAVEALADEAADDGEPRVFPWQPIVAKTIYNRTSSLVTMFGFLSPSFLKQQVELRDPEAPSPEVVDAAGLQRILSVRVSNEMTYAHRTFCRALVIETDQQRLLLSMHMICWSDAQRRWKTFKQQGRHERMQTMNLCILAAILSLVVHIPFRARTVTEMALEGSRPDLSLPKGGKRIEFHIAAKRMKVPKDFDAVLEDTKLSRPRQILDWFIAGPRQELLKDPQLLPLENRRPERLFCGVGRARYNRVLVEWTEEVGLRMTTHLFRHALASVLINCCGLPLAEAANLLGNSAATAERQYVFQDLIRRRSEAIQNLANHREHLVETRHPGRRRK